MTKNKLFFLTAFLVVINVIFYSKGFIGASIHHESIVIAGLSIALPIISVAVLVYGYRSWMNKPERVEYDVRKIQDAEDYKKAIAQTEKRLKFLSKQFDKMKEQIDKIERKKEALFEYLRQNQKINDLFKEEAIKTEQYILNNIKDILNQCILIEASKNNSKIIEEYKDEIAYIDNIIQKNDKTLEIFQDFLHEVSLYGEKKNIEDFSLRTTIQVLKDMRGENNFKISDNRKE